VAVATKKKTARKKTTKEKIRKGSKYVCSVCGIAVRVDEVCGCVGVCDILCCGRQMKPGMK